MRRVRRCAEEKTGDDCSRSISRRLSMKVAKRSISPLRFTGNLFCEIFVHFCRYKLDFKHSRIVEAEEHKYILALKPSVNLH